MACSDGKGGLPSDFLGEALEELSRYKSVEVRGTRVTDIVPAGEAFEFRMRGRDARHGFEGPSCDRAR